jgi:hypothetical protein
MNNDFTTPLAPYLALRGALRIALRTMMRRGIRIIRLFDVPTTLRAGNNMTVRHRRILLALSLQTQRQLLTSTRHVEAARGRPSGETLRGRMDSNRLSA